jgi:hypothetical protein
MDQPIPTPTPSPRGAGQSSAPAAPVLDLGPLGLEDGATVLLRRALAAPAAAVALVGLPVHGTAVDLALHLSTWARGEGERFRAATPAEVLAAGAAPSGARLVGFIEPGPGRGARWAGAERSGGADARAPGALAERAPAHWGLAARGAAVEAGGPRFHFQLDRRDALWADEVQSLLAQALAGQWSPAQAIPWDLPRTHSDELEDALAQVLTYLIENETAALIVPARFAAQVHPHFREVQQLLAITAADEARHIEVFTRRLGLFGRAPGLSTAGGQRSLQTLVDEPDFELASLLLSVLGEGSFVQLLWFLHEHAPDEATRALMKLSAQDEARHVAFAVAHLRRHGRLDPGLAPRLAAAIEQRHAALASSAGLNAEVWDALVLLAAGESSTAVLPRGQAAVLALTEQMRRGRRQRLELLGFPAPEAERLAGLHTKNFM